MKYDSQLAELKNLLPNAKNILIAVAAGADADKLAAGLSLFLTFEAQGKEVNIVSDDSMLVSHTHLFGVDHVQKTLPSTDGGNLTLTLEGVAGSDGTVPALEKLDWYAENNNLNLVFHVLSNQTFQPARIVPHYQGSGFNLIFALGAANLDALGSIYQQNAAAFSGTHIVNIDIQPANTSFGQTNILDSQASSLSEVIASVMSDLGFTLDADTASNILAGIFDATHNLSDSKVTAETYMAVANCLRVGGRKPSVSTQGQSVQQTPAIPQQPAYDWNAVAAAIGQPITPQSAPGFITPQVVSSTSQVQAAASVGDQNQPSPEERPAGEGVVSETVEPEWLTPKIFKGTSIG